MVVHIQVECINAAFDGPGRYRELLRILKTVPGKVRAQRRRSRRCLCNAPESADKLLDINGNTVGKVWIEEGP